MAIVAAMKTVKAGGLTLAYREAGNPKNPALILLHGWPHSSGLYAGVLEDLARNSWVLVNEVSQLAE